MSRTWSTWLLSRVLPFLVILQATAAWNILGLFPHPDKSHFDVFSPLMRGLANKGHNVTVVSHFPEEKLIPRYKDISLRDESPPDQSNDSDVDIHKYRQGPLSQLFSLIDMGYKDCEDTLNNPGVQQLLKTADKYDVIISELYVSDCMLGIVHHFQAPNIAISSSYSMPWVHERFGNIDNPSYVPIMFLGYANPMSLTQRFNNFLKSRLMNTINYFFSECPTDAILKKYFGDIPSVSELKYSTSMLFVNTHYTLTGVRPLVPAVLEIGGIHVEAPKALDKELNDFISGAEDGVIYVNWGSIIRSSTLPEDKLTNLLEALGSLKQRVVWKWDKEMLPGKPANVLIRKWLPQRDILAHPNIRGFMTHGGMLGITEAVHCGVPVVSTPLYGDQFMNTASVIAREIGVELPYDDISKDTILEALNTILEPRYKENAKQLSISFRSRPTSPLNLAIWWVEFVARTNGEPLIRAPFVAMSWVQYTLLDVFAMVFAGLLLIAFIVWVLSKIAFRKILKQVVRIKNKNIKKSKLEKLC